MIFLDVVCVKCPVLLLTYDKYIDMYMYIYIYICTHIHIYIYAVRLDYLYVIEYIQIYIYM